ncbi:cation/calcium exchanger [Vairimorpha necatrix]|uniref:Cation/calcium exchanger n=1 Tax=Vairimorpha necatrix TaxID=6039 RepID=A0AAX4JE08_9MICR
MINIQNLSMNQYLPLLTLFSFIHTLLFSLLITQYHTKIIEHFFIYLNISNMYKMALIHSVIMNLPRIYFIISTDLYTQSTFINGFSATYLSLGMGLVILTAHYKTLIRFESFLKDIFALTGGLAIQALCLNGWQITPLHIRTAGLIFSIYLSLTLRLKYSPNRQNPQVTARMPFLFLKNINEFTTRHIYDLIILNLDNFHKQSIYTSMQILFSPVINTVVLLLYFKPIKDTQKILLSLFISFFTGLILMKSSKKQNSQIINYFYGLISSIFYITIFLDRSRLLIDHIGMFISKKFLDTVVSPVTMGFPEFLHLIYHSRRTSSSMSACSIINSNIFTTLCFGYLKRYFTGNNQNIVYSGDQVSVSFGTISVAVMFFNYIMKNQKLSKDLGSILIFIYFMFVMTFVLDYDKFIKKY